MKEATIFPINLMLDIFYEENKCGNFPADLEGTVWYIISRFDTRVRDVIIGRYKDGKSYEQLGGEIGVSRERIRQIELKALRQMRTPKCKDLLSTGIAEYISQIRISTVSKQISAATEVFKIVADRLAKITGDDEVAEIMEKERLKSRRTITIDNMELSVRTFNVLARAGLRTVDDILNFGDLRNVQNIGQKSLDEIAQKLRNLGFDISIEE